MLWAVVGVCILTVPLARGRLSRFADLHQRLQRRWSLFAALGLQVAILKLWPHGATGLHQALYLLSYGLGGIFVWSNRRLPGLWLIAAGGLSNFVAIAANRGIMPGAPSAFAAAHLVAAPSQFVNSRAVVDPRLGFLGDIFAVPGWLPFHNVFSIGDICIVLGCFIALHRISGSRLLPSGVGQFAGVLKERSFRRLWLAQAISNQGDWVYSMAVVTTVARSRGATHALAVLVITQAAPRALASALGGPIVDRFHRKWLMVGTDLARAVAVGSLLVGGVPTMGHFYLVAVCLGLFGAIFQPSLQASIPNVVPAERLVAANALVSVTFQAAVMVGPLLGALLVQTLGLGPAFAVNAASFVISAALVTGVAVPHTPRREGGPAGLLEGARYALSNRMVRGILIVTGLVMVAAANRAPLEPLLVLDVLHAAPTALGLATAVWGLGMLLGSTAAPAASRRWSCERLLGLSIGLVGVAVLAGSQAAAVASLFGLWLFAGAGNAVGTIAYQSLLQAKTPDALRGRIVAASEMVLDLAYLAGVSVAGVLATLAGVRAAVAVSGLLFLLAAVVSQIVLPHEPADVTLDSPPGGSQSSVPHDEVPTGVAALPALALELRAYAEHEARLRADLDRWELSVAVVGLGQDGRGPLHRPPGPGEPPLVDRQLGTARVDRFTKPLDGEVGQLLGDGLEPGPDVRELAGHLSLAGPGQ